MSIKCTICGSEYYSATPQEDSTQGEDCASCVMDHDDKYYILGCYGSKFDADLFMFLGEPPDEWIDADPVCDRCIQKMIDQGLVEKVDGEYPFGPPWADASIGDGLDDDNDIDEDLN